jgi:hypothetical protein
MPLSKAPTDAGKAFGADEPTHAGQAFGQAPVPGSRRLLVLLARRARLVTLLFCVAVAAIVLVRSNVFVTHDSVFSAFSSGRSAAASPTSECVPGHPPELATVGAEQLLELRAAVQKNGVEPCRWAGVCVGLGVPGRRVDRRRP